MKEKLISFQNSFLDMINSYDMAKSPARKKAVLKNIKSALNNMQIIIDAELKA